MGTALIDPQNVAGRWSFNNTAKRLVRSWK
jgi:hypothetical protein